MIKPRETGFRRMQAACRYSAKGLRCCWDMEAAFRQELVACVFLFPAALFFGESAVEKALLIGVCFIVLIVELLNSGIEAVVDRIGDELHILSGRAKDMASAAVMLSLLLFFTVWILLIFF